MLRPKAFKLKYKNLVNLISENNCKGGSGGNMTQTQSLWREESSEHIEFNILESKPSPKKKKKNPQITNDMCSQSLKKSHI